MRSFSPSLFPEMLEEDHHNYYYDHQCTGGANGQSQEVDLREAYGLHDAELDLPNQPINVRRVLHLTGVCPVVIKLQLPEEDGDVIPLGVPIPGHSVLEAPTHGLEGIHMVVENKLLRAPISRTEIPGHRESITHWGKAGESAF